MKNLILLSLSFCSIVSFGQLKPVAYYDDNQKLNGYSIAPKKVSKNNPGILILPAWKGIDNHAKDSAEKLSEMGYNAFIADIYGEGNYPKNIEDAGKQAGFYKKNVANYQKRIMLALEQLIKADANPDNIVVIGYCFGGTGVLEAARAGMDVKGVVSFHGGLGRDATRPNNTINTKVLVLHGAEDPYVSKQEVDAFQQEMKDTKADYQMIFYANAVHSFTDIEAGNDNSKGAAYNEKAEKHSWKHMKLFLNEVLEK
jgi:dienelactone hydrolase